MEEGEDQLDSTEEFDINGNQMRRKFRYPERPDAEDCSYYLRTGRCRFGMSCKFNHPVPRKIQNLNHSIYSNTVSTEMNPNNSVHPNTMSIGMNLKNSMNSNKLYVGTITREQILAVINFIIEVPTLVLEQLLSSKHQREERQELNGDGGRYLGSIIHHQVQVNPNYLVLPLILLAYFVPFCNLCSQ